MHVEVRPRWPLGPRDTRSTPKPSGIMQGKKGKQGGDGGGGGGPPSKKAKPSER